MLSSTTRKVWSSGRVDRFFQPTDLSGVGYVLPSAPRRLTYAQTVLADSPVVFLQFEEASGSLLDSSGNSLNGTANGSVTYHVTGPTGTGFGISLGGTTSDYISVADNSLLDILTDITIEAWVKLAAFPASQAAIVSKNYDSNGAWGLVVLSDGKVKLDRTGVSALGTSTGSITAGSWHHIAVTRSGSTITFYINGSSAGTASSSTNFSNTSKPMTVGVWDVAGSFGGNLGSTLSVDSVAVYNTGLSGARIGAHYSAGL